MNVQIVQRSVSLAALVTPDGERTMLPDVGANAAVSPADLPGDVFVPGGHLHLSGFAALAAARARQAWPTCSPASPTQ